MKQIIQILLALLLPWNNLWISDTSLAHTTTFPNSNAPKMLDQAGYFGEGPKTASLDIQPVTTLPTQQKATIEQSSPYLILGVSPYTRSVTNGTVLTATFFARSISGTQNLTATLFIPIGLNYVAGSSANATYNALLRLLTWSNIGINQDQMFLDEFRLTANAPITPINYPLVVTPINQNPLTCCQFHTGWVRITKQQTATLMPAGGHVQLASRVWIDYEPDSVPTSVPITLTDYAPVLPDVTAPMGLSWPIEFAPDIEFNTPMTITLDLSGVVSSATFTNSIALDFKYLRPVIVTETMASGAITHEIFQEGGIAFTFDANALRLTARLDHFSQYEVSLSLPKTPDVWKLNPRAANVGLFRGSAEFSYPIETPPMNGGLQPDLTLRYSSASADSGADGFAPGMGVTAGKGWELGIPRITRAVKRNWEMAPWGNGSDWTHCNWYDANYYQSCFAYLKTQWANDFSLTLNGRSYNLIPKFDPNVQTGGEYVTESYEALRILRCNTHYTCDIDAFPGADPSREYWQVWTPDGTRYVFGVDASSVNIVDQQARHDEFPTVLGAANSDGIASYNPVVAYNNGRSQYAGEIAGYISRIWFLRRVYAAVRDDVNIAGRWSVEWSYVDGGYAGGKDLIARSAPGKTYSATDTLTRPVYVTYGPSIKLDGSAASQRYKATFDYGYGTRLNWITVALVNASTGSVIANIHRTQARVDQGWPAYPSMTDVLYDIHDEAWNGSSWVGGTPTTTLTYQEFPHNNGQGGLLAKVENGYGGEWLFNYAGNQVWNSYWVTTSTVKSGAGTIVTRTYEYQTPCIATPAGVGQCLNGAHVHFDEYPNNYVGFASTNERVLDSTGLTVTNGVHSFYNSDLKKLGREYRTVSTDAAGNAMSASETDYTEYTIGLPSGAWFVAASEARVYPAGGITSTLIGKTTYGYDIYANTVRVTEYGFTNAAGDERTTTSGYFPNTTKWIVSAQASKSIYKNAHETISPPAGDLLEQTLRAYDGNALWSDIPTKGQVTKLEYGNVVTPSLGYASQRVAYDALGNISVITDGLGFATSASYEANGWFMTSVLNAQGQVSSACYYGVIVCGSQVGSGQFGQLQATIDPNGIYTSFDYDVFGRLVKVVQDGDTISIPTRQYIYTDNFSEGGARGLKVESRQRETAGNASAYFQAVSFYDGLGQLIQTRREDPAGVIVTSNRFDIAGRPFQSTVPYPSSGMSYTAPDWNTAFKATTEYDALGRVTVITGTDGLTTMHEYGTGVGNVWHRVVDANLHTKVDVTDGLGRMIAVEEYTGTYTATQSLYATTVYAYDPLGNLTGLTDALNNTTVITYNALNLKIGMKDPDMGVWGYVYDANGNLISQSDAKGNILTFEYDKLSRLTGKYLGATRLAGYAYDVARAGQSNFGQRGVMWNAEDATTFDYDARGRLSATSKSIGQNVTVYEAESAPYGHGCGTSGGAAWLSPGATGGSACHIAFGPYQSPQTAGPRQTAIFRLAIDVVDGQQDTVATIDVRDAATGSILATRDLKRGEFKGGIGNFSEFALDFDTTGRGGNPFEYRVLWMNRANMAHDKTILVWNSQPYQTDYTYDSADRMVTMKYPQTQSGRETVNAAYNAAMQPLSQVGAYSYVSNASYNVLGQPARIDFGNGLNTQYRYWGLTFTQTGLATNTFYGRLRGICVNSYGSGVACADGDASANVRMNLAYAYDKVGNISNMGDRTRSEGLAFTYDELDRLLSFSIGGTSVETYTYDKIGNITGKGGAIYTYQDSKPHAVTHINGLRVASYDNNGNMATRTESATYAQKFDVENRLTDVNGVHFAYDADGALIKKVEGSKTTTYIGNYFEKELAAVFVPSTMRSYGSQWKLDNVALPGGKTRKYYYFGGQRVAVRENDGVPQWIHGDHLGSASVTTDNSGAKAGEDRYKPFGGSRVDSGDVKGNKRFQGSERVNSIELDSMGARFYSAGLGRFISADTIVPGAGNPQALNRYAFVLNNPLRLTDPTGHAQMCDPCDEEPSTSHHFWWLGENGQYGRIDTHHLKNFPKESQIKLWERFKQGLEKSSPAGFDFTIQDTLLDNVWFIQRTYHVDANLKNPEEAFMGIYLDFANTYEFNQVSISGYANEDIPSDYLGAVAAIKSVSPAIIVQQLALFEAAGMYGSDAETSRPLLSGRFASPQHTELNGSYLRRVSDKNGEWKFLPYPQNLTVTASNKGWTVTDTYSWLHIATVFGRSIDVGFP